MNKFSLSFHLVRECHVILFYFFRRVWASKFPGAVRLKNAGHKQFWTSVLSNLMALFWFSELDEMFHEWTCSINKCDFKHSPCHVEIIRLMNSIGWFILLYGLNSFAALMSLVLKGAHKINLWLGSAYSNIPKRSLHQVQCKNIWHIKTFVNDARVSHKCQSI